MTPVTVFSGRKVALFGLGGSGLATARALKAGGAEVAAWDDNEKSRETAAAEGIAAMRAAAETEVAEAVAYAEAGTWESVDDLARHLMSPAPAEALP